MVTDAITSVFPNNTDVVSVQGGYGVMIGTIIFFNILNRIVSYIGVPVAVVKHAVNKEEEAWKWKNLLLSWIHAFIVGLWDILCFYYYPEIWQDLITHITPFTYYMVAVSTGYFMYDFGDLIVQKKVLEMWQLTLHHIAVTSMFFYNLTTRRCVAYNVVALMAEINSFFLHSRKLMQMQQFKFSSPIYQANALVNLVTFLFCRGFGLGRITYGMIVEGHRVDSVYFYTLTGSMFIMNMINPGLFIILLKNDFLRKDYHSKATKKQLRGSGESVKPVQNGLHPTESTDSLPGYSKLLAEGSIDAHKID
ncbi:hypothetical protein BOX15_Mlig017238g1 [Macrostomum lignano]|uniref:TLC domain-containing protein n=1 Tax=Macrostomum lignano TaxID=282301 RepID=A0A267GUP4_9PLAT|nr:hypothetical protein BOX15_Mlig017238g1 [Macrostomum lignano]